MGGRALGVCGGRWPWRGVGAGALGGGGLGAGSLEGRADGQGVGPRTSWASRQVGAWPLALKLERASIAVQKRLGVPRDCFNGSRNGANGVSRAPASCTGSRSIMVSRVGLSCLVFTCP